MAETTTRKKTGKKAKKSHWDDYYNEYVNVYVPMNDSGSKEPLLLIHNGRAYLFERGRNHRMKRFLAKIYEDALKAKQIQYMRISEMQEQTRASLANPTVIS